MPSSSATQHPSPPRCKMKDRNESPRSEKPLEPKHELRNAILVAVVAGLIASIASTVQIRLSFSQWLDQQSYLREKELISRKFDTMESVVQQSLKLREGIIERNNITVTSTALKIYGGSIEESDIERMIFGKKNERELATQLQATLIVANTIFESDKSKKAIGNFMNFIEFGVLMPGNTEVKVSDAMLNEANKEGLHNSKQEFLNKYYNWKPTETKVIKLNEVTLASITALNKELESEQDAGEEF